MQQPSSKYRDPFYLSKTWKALRQERLKIDGYICQHCGIRCLGKRKGLPSPHVDHKVDRKTAPEKELDITNLQTLCLSCHNKKTRADEQNKPAIGEDGYLL